uniref:Uncharacterized protein MANES_05G003600 n=1 Tax=Rhizophora mucronata TaxID=61149 RepID=A0A2P2LJZ6_RHIMU
MDQLMYRELVGQFLLLPHPKKPKQAVRWHNNQINLHHTHPSTNPERFELEQHFSVHWTGFLGLMGLKVWLVDLHEMMGWCKLIEKNYPPKQNYRKQHSNIYLLTETTVLLSLFPHLQPIL